MLRAQNNLMYATNSVSESLERMSTGFKINSAKDDAAGLYIATGLNTQIRGLKQAQKNTADGISLLNTAEGSLSNMKDMLQRIRDLSIQGANGIYDDSARGAMQDEADALIAEIQRVYASTTFNGKNLFAGAGSDSIAAASWKVNTDSTPRNSVNNSGISGVSALSSDTIPAGYTAIYTAEDLDNIRNDLDGKYILMNDIDLSGINWDPIGEDYKNPFTGVLEGNGHIIKNLTISSNDTNKVLGLFGCTDNAEIKNVGLDNANIKGVHRTGGIIGDANGTNNFVSNCFVTGDFSGSEQVGGIVGWGEGSIINCYFDGNVSGSANVAGIAGCAMYGTKISDVYSSGKISGDQNIGGIVGYSDNCNIINAYTNANILGNIRLGGIGGSIGGANSSVANSIFDIEKTGQNLAIGSGSTTPTNTRGLTTDEMKDPANWQGWDTNIWDFSSFPPSLKNMPAPSATGNIRLQVGANADADANAIYIDLSFDIGSFDIDFSDVQSSADSIDTVDEVLDRISAKISEIGAVMNRLESVSASQMTQIENFTAAKSTIMDADMAEEAAEYTRQQILQQTTSALLTQAQNSDTSVIYALIGGI